MHAALDLRDLCIAPGAFMAFHAIRSFELGKRMFSETGKAYLIMPAPIKRWIDDNGGHHNLPSTATGRCTIARCGLWATRNASEGYVRKMRVRIAHG